MCQTPSLLGSSCPHHKDFTPSLGSVSSCPRRQGGSVTVNCWARLQTHVGGSMRYLMLASSEVGGEGSLRFLARPSQGAREQPFLTLQGQIYNSSRLIKSRPLNQYIHCVFSLPEPRAPSSRPDLLCYWEGGLGHTLLPALGTLEIGSTPESPWGPVKRAG